jgi:hypothetical protein
MSVKVPTFLADHPLEGLLAACLLLGLLFLSTDDNSPLPEHHPLVAAASGR